MTPMTREEQILATQLEQSLRRLSSQNGANLSLQISLLITVVPGRNPVRRSDGKGRKTVNIDQLAHVSVGYGSKDVGLCVRMVFGDHLYATCGADAEAIKSWAEQSRGTLRLIQIEDFPVVSFQHAVKKVEIH